MVATSLRRVDALDTGGRPLATWGVRRPWLVLVLVSLGGVVLTVAGSAAGQIAGLALPAATLLTAAFVAASALVGVGVMAASRRPLGDYGFRAPVRQRATWWGLPLVLVIVALVALDGFEPKPELVWPYLALTLAVGFNEEVWFRGLALAAVRRLGTRPAIAGGALVFGLVHLSNALAGKPGLYLALQFAFATLVGFVLAELVAVTGSLWVPIVWHFAYDFFSFNSGGSAEALDLLAPSVMTVLLLLYAALLWRRLPAEPRG